MQIQTEQPKNGADEHILVCLSSSPSNARIIHTAAKMAKVLHAKFTAIYVQTDTVINDEDQSRLSQNIQLAQRLGAEIVMTHGENVALQISEYVRLSDVTKIVIEAGEAEFERLMFEISAKPINIFLDVNAVIVNLDSLPPEKQKSCIAEIQENISVLKSYLEDNIREKENTPSIPETGMAVLRQQYVLVEAIQAWISSLNII